MESPQQEKSESHESHVKPGHIRGLNGLRAIAVLLVLFRHNFYLFRQSTENAAMLPVTVYDWNTLFLNGWLGVDLFFVLSGFLISRPFFNRDKKPFTIKAYALKRIFRIIPAYYFVMLLIVISAFPFYEIATQDFGWRIFYHAIFMQDYLAPDINVVFWSLGVEEKFYILTPLIFLLIPFIKSDHMKLAVFLIPVFAGPALRYLSYEMSGATDDYYEFFRTARAPFHTCLEPLFLGVCIALCESKKLKPLAPKLVFWGAAIGLSALMLSHEMMKDIGYFDAVFQPFIIAWFMAGLVYGVVFGVELKILQNRITDFFAKISYSLYLLHWPLFPLAIFIAITITQHTLLLFFVSTLVFFALSIIAAGIQYALIEKPFLKIKDKF